MDYLKLDYYVILGVPKDSDQKDLCLAYKKLAMLYHPTLLQSKKAELGVKPESECNSPDTIREKRNLLENKENFYNLGEAYDILGDPEKRAIYDMFGFRGLKEGVMSPQGYVPPIAYHGDPNLTFQQFFGLENPFSEMANASCVPFNTYAVNNDGASYLNSKPPPIQKELLLSLEEMYRGCVKKILFTRIRNFGSFYQPHAKMLTINVKPGAITGTKFVFPNEGDEGNQHKPADVEFIVSAKPHKEFTLYEQNLMIFREIPLSDSLTGFKVKVNTLDERSFTVIIGGPILPGYEKVLEGEGFPSMDPNGKPGNLIIRITVVYPALLTKEQRKKLKEAF